MNFHDLRKPDFGNGPQEYVVNRLVFKTLKAGFDPRGDAFELMQAMKGDLENLRSERGFTYTKSQISWMLHRMVRHVLDKGDAASYGAVGSIRRIHPLAERLTADLTAIPPTTNIFRGGDALPFANNKGRQS